MKMNRRVNAVCLAGAILGLISIITPWFGEHTVLTTPDGTFGMVGGNLTLINLLGYSAILGELFGSVYTILALGCIIFLVGTIVAFISPMGGVFQLTGISIFSIQFLGASKGVFPGGIGMYIGGISGIVVISSLFLPIWIGKKSEGTGIKSRLLTFGPIVRKCSSCGKVGKESDFCKYCGAKID